MDSGRLALGPFVDEFENKFATACGTRHAIAVSSGTAALHLIVRALGITAGDEVVTSPYSFVASANAPLFEGAIPVFADIDPRTYNIDPDRIEDAITEHTKAILAVDVFGLPADWARLREIADKHGLLLIDDSCEAIGASVGNMPIGSLADASAFGFYPNKQITTGEGGCITTNSDEVARLCRSMRNQGRSDDRVMSHARLGYNYRMAELPAAIGCAQLDRLPELLAKRRAIANLYVELLTGANCTLPRDTAGRSWFVYVIEISRELPPGKRDELITALQARGIQSAPYFPCIHTQPFYRDELGWRSGDFPIAESVSERTLAIPFFPDLSEAEVRYIAEIITELIPT